MSTLKVIFAGTPDFAVPSLQAVIDSNHEVVAVYSQPDRPAGRGRKLMASPVKQLALAHQLPVYQPVNFKSDEAIEQLQALDADLMVVAAYGLILPAKVLSLPRLGCINVHASLLPKYRGASPIQQALLNGDKTSGVTLMQMDVGLDTGDMLAKVSCDIDACETGQSLHDKLSTLANDELIHLMERIANNKSKPEKQDDSQASYAHKISKADGKIDWAKSARDIERQIRAYNPWPVAHTLLDGKVIRVWMAKQCELSSCATPGSIIDVSQAGIDIACGGNSVLRISELQLSGAKRMSVSACLNAKASLFSVDTLLGDS